ncbi:MAG: LptA/OstA family protein [Vulcanimicrobiaceae bacterium]
MKRIAVLWMALALGTQAVLAAGPAAKLTFGDWEMSASQIDYTWTNGNFSVPDHLRLTRPGSSIDADRADGNEKRKIANLYGHVVMHDDRGTFSAISGTSKPGKAEPATLTCDKLTVDGVSRIYTATGNVHFVQGANSMEADTAIMDMATHELHLRGHVHVVQQ